MHAKVLKLHKGVDNKLQFRFLNQEQKPVDITGKEITVRILNYDGSTILLQKSLVHDLPLTGITTLHVSSTELANIDAQQCSYSIEIPDGNNSFPAYVDALSGARGVLHIENSVLPSFVPAVPVSIPSYAPPVTPSSVNFSSSIFNTKDSDSLTVQMSFMDFIGRYTIQGSTSTSSDWYDIVGGEFTEPYSESAYASIIGYHPYIRVNFVLVGGTVKEILTR